MHCQKEDEICPEVTGSSLQPSPRVLRKPAGESRAGEVDVKATGDINASNWLDIYCK